MTRAEAQALADRLLEHPKIDAAELRLSYPEREQRKLAADKQQWSVVIHDTVHGWLLLQVVGDGDLYQGIVEDQ